MRVAGLKIRGAMLAGLAALAGSCGGSKKPVAATVPAAPPMAASSPAPRSQAASSPAPAQAPDNTHTPPVAVAPVEPKVADFVGDLVASAERQYQSGLARFQAGQVDDAKRDFDGAFNTLLEGKLDIHSDNRLEQEFERIVDGVNQLNLGGGATESEAQKPEPAPIDETNEITPAATPDVTAKAQAEIKSTHSDLPLMMTDQVAGYISYFSNRGRGTFERAFARSGRYHDMMVRILREEGVPRDLIYLAQAESGFQPLAVSRAGARGIWQFMGSRALGYGLTRSPWVDDRQDPEKSTRAAARHLKDLYAQFGDWYLAMAAYNSGPGTVQAAVRRTGYADFWELYRRNVLPKETRNYVPIILAVTIMAKNLSHYGFDDVSMEEPIPHDTVKVDYAVDLRLVADCVDAPATAIQQLNPSLLRLSTPKDGTFELHLPVGSQQKYQTAIAGIPVQDRVWWRYPTVLEGETLASLARKYRVTVKSLADANHFEANQANQASTGELQADSKIIIPLAPNQRAATEKASYAKRITRYKVRKGDTVDKVAKNFGIAPQMVRRWNGLRGESLHGRTVLALHLPVTPNGESVATAKSASGKSAPGRAATARSKAGSAKNITTSAESRDSAAEVTVVHHKVKSGETLYSIATAYNTTVAAIKKSNQNTATLHPGMILVVHQTAR